MDSTCIRVAANAHDKKDMPTNVYFDTGTKPEYTLYEDLMIEQLRIYGQDVYYILKMVVQIDFQEDISSSFESSYLIEMYMENIDGYEGEKELMSKFGFDIQDDAICCCEKKMGTICFGNNNIIVSSRSNEGDLIYFQGTSCLRRPVCPLITFYQVQIYQHIN